MMASTRPQKAAQLFLMSSSKSSQALMMAAFSYSMLGWEVALALLSMMPQTE